MKEQRKFKAFISYRHCPLDMAVAEETQKLIERYQIPREFREKGSKRLGLVFRDVSELPLSSNLTEDIYTALDHSEFLLVVCTPETPKSLWVRQEIDYFIKTHGRERVLAILAAGTPEESLPEALTHVYGADGSLISRIEPLCANLVGKDQKTVLKNLKQEFIRLVAAMLRVPYDDLYQRRKRYLRRLAVAGIGSVTAVLLLIMGLLISWNLDVMKKNEEIARNYRMALEKESQALSLLSEQYLTSGDRKAALQSAMQALEGDHPYLAAAEGALAKALNPYGNGMLSYHIWLELPTSITQLDLLEDGSRLVSADTNDCIRCYDTASGKLLWQWQCDSTLSSYGDQQVRIVCDGRYLLVNSFDFLYLLSMEDGSLVQSKSVRYQGRFTETSANVGISTSGEIVTLFYEPENTHSYEVYDTRTFALLDSFSFSEDTDCFFEHFAAEDGLEALQISAAYSNAGNRLTIAASDGSNWTLEDFKPRPVDMDLDGLDIHRLKDGSLVLVCYLEDTHYSLDPERRAMSVHKLSPQGEEVHRQRFVRDVYLRHQFVGDYLAIFTDEFNSTLEFNTFRSVMRLMDMTDDFRETQVDFGEAGVHDCYIREDGQLVTVMTDGSLRTPLKEVNGIVYTDLPDYDQPIRDAVAASKGTELVCLIPEDATNRVVMLRSARNHSTAPLDDRGEVIRFPSGQRFLTIQYDDETYEKPPLVTVYDSRTLERLDSFTLEPEVGYTDIYGFSADETKLFFGGNNGYAIDLQTHRVTQMRSMEDTPGVSYHQPQSTQIPGQPVVLVVYGGTDTPNEMYWYLNMEPMGSYRFPCEEGTSVYMDWINWNIGGNGLIVCSAFADREPGMPMETFVYSTGDQSLHRVANASAEEGIGTIGVGDVTKVVAFADTDGVIRLYDFDRDAIVNTIPLPVSPSEVSALQFVGQDQYLLVYKRNGSVTFLAAADGTVLGELLLDDPVNAHSALIMEDTVNRQLYICTGSGSTSGYRIDMQTWTVVAKIPGLAAFLPESGQILQRDFYSDRLWASPVYTCEELMKQTGALLDGAESES